MTMSQKAIIPSSFGQGVRSIDRPKGEVGGQEKMNISYKDPDVGSICVSLFTT